MNAKLRAIQGHEATKKGLDSVKLIKKIKLISQNFQEKNYAASSMRKVLEKFETCKQAEEMSVQLHLDKHVDLTKIMNNTGTKLNESCLTVKQEFGDTSSKTTQE